MLCVYAMHALNVNTVFTLCIFGALKMNKETEWTLAKLCVYAMKTLKVNTCYVVCVRYGDT